MRTCYICSPYRAKTEAELDNHIDYAQELTSKAMAAGLAPITPHLYLTQVTNDEIPKQRAQGIEAGQALLLLCDCVIIGNRYGVSAGMQAEIELAKKSHTPVIAVTNETTPAEIAQLVEKAVTYGTR